MYLEPMQQTSNMLQMVLGGIGAIAMLVSAINIANTMIMSIYERTKEIGIMKVLGCIIIDIKEIISLRSGNDWPIWWYNGYYLKLFGILGNKQIWSAII